MKKSPPFIIFLVLLTLISGNLLSQEMNEPHRPQIHFSPKEHWTNDPNGMVYNKGVYHLFFQYYPEGTVWGPMHWGHTESRDLIHWQEQPVALYPDSLGYIFSGSAVVDKNNTSGFGKNGQAPLVAIFTHHDPKGEKAQTNTFQNQSIAYSLDDGRSWTKYSANPVLKNPGITDFRDPKVSWYEAGKKWIMTLATKDRITFFSSPDLKNWAKESEFGADKGAHGGVWECPDLFPMQLNGKTYWILLVSINPGGPNGGSITQYFIGQFDGKTFTAMDDKTKWIDYGPDDYAGITWSNTGERKIFLGWMSNWIYANQVPTEKWRNAMTLPRELSLKDVNGEIFIASNPVKELNEIAVKGKDIASFKTAKLPAQYTVKFSTESIKTYSIILSNADGEKITVGYDQKENRYFINRMNSGKSDFNPDFAKIAYAPRIATTNSSDLELVVDAASLELFADNGLTVMTSIFFPKKPYDRIDIVNKEKMSIKNALIVPLSSIWR